MEKPSARQCFFSPRVIPERYSRGWEGYRTLVLGVFHVCTIEDCPLRAEYLADSSRFDSLCPQYEGMGDYYRLSNSNEIEVESYLEGEVNYPTYSSITKYLLRTNRHVAQVPRRELWDSVAYTNFLQNFRGEYDTLSYAETPELFDSQLPAFKTVLSELRPEVIYVIDTAVADCLRANAADFPGLKFIDENQDWTLPIYRFTSFFGPFFKSTLGEINITIYTRSHFHAGTTLIVFPSSVREYCTKFPKIKERIGIFFLK